MQRPRIILADDQKIFTASLAALLRPNFDVVARVGDGRTLVREAITIRPDLIILEISIPLLNGIEAVRQIRKALPKSKVIVLSRHVDRTYAVRAFRAGAHAYLAKQDDQREFFDAVQRVLSGRTYLTRLITMNGQKSILDETAPQNEPQLTPRQQEVLTLIAEGRSAREIAAILHVSPRTVEFHKYRMMEVLHLSTSAGLIQYAFQHGFVAASS